MLICAVVLSHGWLDDFQIIRQMTYHEGNPEGNVIYIFLLERRNLHEIVFEDLLVSFTE